MLAFCDVLIGLDCDPPKIPLKKSVDHRKALLKKTLSSEERPKVQFLLMASEWELRAFNDSVIRKVS